MRVIGLISGTSVDGIDAAIVDIDGAPDHPRLSLVAGTTYPYPNAVRSRILDLCAGAALSLADLADLDDAIAHTFAAAVQSLQAEQGTVADLIGSHGQTVFHRPRQSEDPSTLAYSLQLGRGDRIAHLTGLTTVSNFRQADIALGGEGAPLVPAVDVVLLSHPTRDRCIQNLGGIGNVTYLPATPDAVTRPPASRRILGWDTGPGNTLLDLAVQALTQGQQRYDANGTWAAQGRPCQDLVTKWLQHPYFRQCPPKSTGRELFGVEFLAQCQHDAQPFGLSEADWLATLTEFTAASIADSYRRFLPQPPDEVLLAGGGSRNTYLCQRLAAHLAPAQVASTDAAGVNADFKEAIAFAVLAYWRVRGYPGNLPAVTGARQAVSLGDIYPSGADSRDRMSCEPAPSREQFGKA